MKIFFLSTTKDIIKFVSIFILVHSIALIFTTFMGVTSARKVNVS
jgi:hypothetical protein